MLERAVLRSNPKSAPTSKSVLVSWKEKNDWKKKRRGDLAYAVAHEKRKGPSGTHRKNLPSRSGEGTASEERRRGFSEGVKEKRPFFDKAPKEKRRSIPPKRARHTPC